MSTKLKDLNNQDAEKSIIAELLNDEKSIANIQELRPKHFYNKNYRNLYRKILEMDHSDKPIDLITLSNEYEDYKVSELSYFIGESISSQKVKEYEKIIIEHWIKRQLYKLSYSFISDIGSPNNDPSKLISELSKKFDDILENNNSEKLGDITNPLSELIEQRVDGIRKNPGVLTGYKKIDNKTGGFQPSDLITIGGDTSTGKTALALNLCENILFRIEPVPIGYISLELDKKCLLDRLLLTKSKIDIKYFYNQNVTADMKNRYQNNAMSLDLKPFYVVDNVTCLPDILTKINLLHKNYDTRIIFIDNLQNILGSSEEDFRKIICMATKSLKDTARRLNISIVALSHLKRKSDKSKPPQLSDLKESSTIEQDSDKVIFIHRPYKGIDNTDYMEDCSLNLAKNRQGHTGIIDIKFNRKVARFEQVPSEQF